MASKFQGSINGIAELEARSELLLGAVEIVQKDVTAAEAGVETAVQSHEHVNSRDRAAGLRHELKPGEPIGPASRPEWERHLPALGGSAPDLGRRSEQRELNDAPSSPPSVIDPFELWGRRWLDLASFTGGHRRGDSVTSFRKEPIHA
jgi:hypothetical protein